MTTNSDAERDSVLAYCQERLRYDEETGLLFRKRVDGSERSTGTVYEKYPGYFMVQIEVMGKNYRAHRLIWLMCTGSWPVGQIDHIDGDASNNRMSNLRECTNAENNQNRTTNRRKSLPIGVTFHKGKYDARIMLHGVQKHLGSFTTPDDAYAAYTKAKSRVHTFNPIQRSLP